MAATKISLYWYVYMACFLSLSSLGLVYQLIIHIHSVHDRFHFILCLVSVLLLIGEKMEKQKNMTCLESFQIVAAFSTESAIPLHISSLFFLSWRLREITYFITEKRLWGKKILFQKRGKRFFPLFFPSTLIFFPSFVFLMEPLWCYVFIPTYWFLYVIMGLSQRVEMPIKKWARYRYLWSRTGWFTIQNVIHAHIWTASCLNTTSHDSCEPLQFAGVLRRWTHSGSTPQVLFTSNEMTSI